MTALLIYIAGACLSLCVSALIQRAEYNRKENYSFRLDDLIIALICMLLSWLGVVVLCLIVGDKIVLYKKGKENE